MALDSVFESAMPAAGQVPRVNLQWVLTGLRHLTGSAEPGRVFAELAAVCVPALCDEMIVDIEEAGNRRYRIRRPGTAVIRSSDELPATGRCRWTGAGERSPSWSG